MSMSEKKISQMTEEEKRIAREKGEATRRRRWEQRQEKKQNQAREAEEQRLACLRMDELFMGEALRQAKKAAALGEIPVGCVIVCQGKAIGRGYNRRQTDRNVLAHAEIQAIRQACEKMGDWRLEKCTIYVTLEPCPMCAGAIVQARIPRVIIGCRNPKAGCAGSVVDLFHVEGFNHQAEVQAGILEAECSEMLSEFFQLLRKESMNLTKELF